jgi:hypothetical protein
MVLNKSSKDVWMYQAVVGTSIITAVNSVSYEFGEYSDECGKWSIPITQNPAESHWLYNSGTPTLINLERKFPTFKRVFLPVSAQVYAWMQGLPENATPAVNISTVEAEFRYGGLEDVNDNPNLTTAPLAAGLMTGSYNGNPILEWNAVPIPGVEKAVWMEKKESEIVSSDEGVTQIVHTGKSETVKVILFGGIEVDDMWDDYKARTTRNMTIQVKKFDDTSNILFTFTNCRITSYERIGDRYKGKYASIIRIEAEKVTEVSDWFTEGGVTFADHWRAAI